MDMALALHWVHSNIERFGGDKDNVTLYGSGTGAAAAQYLMVSKHVPEYHYNRAILSRFEPRAEITNFGAKELLAHGMYL